MTPGVRPRIRDRFHLECLVIAVVSVAAGFIALGLLLLLGCDDPDVVLREREPGCLARCELEYHRCAGERDPARNCPREFVVCQHTCFHGGHPHGL